jgi:hypothetical protein
MLLCYNGPAEIDVISQSRLINLHDESDSIGFKDDDSFPSLGTLVIFPCNRDIVRVGLPAHPIYQPLAAFASRGADAGDDDPPSAFIIWNCSSIALVLSSPPFFSTKERCEPRILTSYSRQMSIIAFNFWYHAAAVAAVFDTFAPSAGGNNGTAPWPTSTARYVFDATMSSAVPRCFFVTSRCFRCTIASRLALHYH